MKKKQEYRIIKKPSKPSFTKKFIEKLMKLYKKQKDEDV